MSKATKFFRHPWRFWADALAWRRALKESQTTNTHGPVVVYFDGQRDKIYQIEQWLGPLAALHATVPVTLVCRTRMAAAWAFKHTPFKVVFCPKLLDLMDFYQRHPIRCILYVNNGYRNFQSLINARALHVHINHGESDKLSTFSNQTKAYDYVLVAGPAAVDKYDRNLIKKDLSKYRIIGRPQLEHIAPISLPPPPEGCHTTVLYAPTWEGTYDDMNYSSVATMGLALVQALLNDPGYRVLYRPHPSTGKRLPAVAKANQAIKTLVAQHPNGLLVPQGDINALFAHAHLAVLDNSAVAVDYLAAGKPLLMTDWLAQGTDGGRSMPLITQAATLIGPSQAGQVCPIVEQLLQHDPMASQREQVRQRFLGPFNAAQQQSTQAFIQAVSDVCQECEQLIQAQAAQHAS